MNDDEFNNGNGQNDYGDEDYNNNANMDGGQDMEGGDNPGGDEADPDVDQYFDDAGDIGYLPADHVTSLSSLPFSPSWHAFKMLWLSSWQTSMKE